MNNWQLECEQSFRCVESLCRFLGIPNIYPETPDFPLLVPVPFAQRMQKSAPADPLLRQILPVFEESLQKDGFVANPLCECPNESGFLHKYEGRALLLATNACSVHCRFCFRRGIREIIQEQPMPSVSDCEEIILSGGDPLMLSDEKIAKILGAFPNAKRFRVHTRMPIMIPSRVTDSLIEIFKQHLVFIVLHVNHPNEIDENVENAIRKFWENGVPILSQSVLLKGVNDSFETLFSLFNKLINNRVIPYYLHQLDKVAGASHFEVDESHGRILVQRLRESLPGYAVPRYVKEIPLGRFKMDVFLS